MSFQTPTQSFDDKKKIIIEDGAQKKSLEKEISDITNEFDTLFNKEELLKFIFKYFEESSKEQGDSEEEIDSLRRKMKELFDALPDNTFDKYHKRIKNALKKQVFPTLYERLKIESEPKHHLYKIQEENVECEEQKKNYEKTNNFKQLMEETLYLSQPFVDAINEQNEQKFYELNEFYKDKNDVCFSNIINGEEKFCDDIDIIKKVVETKEIKGEKYLGEIKDFVTDSINLQKRLDKEISDIVQEIDEKEDEKETLQRYNSGKNYIKELNELEFN